MQKAVSGGIEKRTAPTIKTSSEIPMASRRWLKIGLTIAAVAAVVVIGVIGYVWFSGGTGQATTAISAPVLKPTGTGKLFRIVAEQSEVRFIIDEILIGQPKRVVGKTSEVAGDLVVDFTTPTNSQLGIIRINVRTLTTDNEFRNKALRGQILQATNAQFEFATFAPTKLVGLPETLSTGTRTNFQIVGKLAVHGVSREVTFDASVTPNATDTITGTAKVTVRYKDYNIAIPEAPGVANISEDVQLEIDFTATAVSA